MVIYGKMIYGDGESHCQMTDDVTTLKGQGHDPNMLRTNISKQLAMLFSNN